MRVLWPLFWGLLAGLLGIGWMVFVVYNYKGGHGPSRMQAFLDHMQRVSREGVEVGFALPEEELFNGFIRETYEHAQREEDYDLPDPHWHNPHFDSLMHLEMQHGQLRWNRPPIYVVNPELPDGFGFYLLGEDGVSATQGNDPDDINSWDRQSHRFYDIRRSQRELMNTIIVGLATGGLVFMVLVLRGARNRRFS